MHNCDYLLALDPAGDSNSFIHLPQFPKCVFGRVNLHSVEYLQVLFMQVFFFFRSKADAATTLCIFLEKPKRHGREVEADVAEPRSGGGGILEESYTAGH